MMDSTTIWSNVFAYNIHLKGKLGYWRQDDKWKSDIVNVWLIAVIVVIDLRVLVAQQSNGIE